MRNKKGSKERTSEALNEFQEALDHGQIIQSPYDPNKVIVRKNLSNRRKQSPHIIISYTEILNAGGYLIPLEVNPAYAKAGRVGHKLITQRLEQELVFPDDRPDEEKIAQLLQNPELASIDEEAQRWMFSENRPTSRGIAQAVIGVIKFFFSLGRKNPTFEQTVLIPAGEYQGRRVFIQTRGDSVDGNIGEEVTVDNFKTGKKDYQNPQRIHLDMYMQGLTAEAVENGRESTRDIWRNGTKIKERIIVSQKPLNELTCRLDPPGRIVYSDGVAGDGVHFENNGRRENKRLQQLVDQCVQKKR